MLSALRRSSGAVLAAVLVAAVLPVLAVSPTAAAPAPRPEAEPEVVAAFSPLDGFRQAAGRRTSIRPTAYAAAALDIATARSGLALAPTADQVAAGAQPVQVSLPAPDGSEVVFAVAEDSVLAPQLQADHPELRTYAGSGVTDPTDTIRFSLTPLGLHASVRSLSSHRTWYIDPAYHGRGVTAHLSYLRGAIPVSDRVLDERAPARPDGVAAPAAPVERVGGAVVVQRTYRMAFVTEQTYAAYFGTANVLSTKTIQVNRADHIYMDDMAIKFVLAEGSDDLNLDTDAKAIGVDGPCGASPCFTTEETSSCGGDVLDRNKFVAGQIVGADRFDIGHFGSGDGSGGVAYLGVVGGEDKAGGCTALDPPAGDFYAIDFFAHEVGHQMGGNHTFDGVNGSCAGLNRNAPTSVEPGSGSSVMAYAGICFNDDLQAHTDPYFSQATIEEFTAVTTADPESLSEEQVGNLKSLDTGDTFELTYPGAPAQTITMGANYNASGLAAAVLALTGKTATVTGYDGDSSPSADGFTVDFGGTADVERLGIGATTGGVTGFIGVTQNGGPITNGGAPTSTTNHRPVVVAPADKTLPVQTPFTLTASATDEDSGDEDALTYLWEQNDQGLPGDPFFGFGAGTALASPTKTVGPLFRVFGTYADVSDADTLLYESPGENLATTEPARTFPDIAQVLAGDTDAEEPCPTPTTSPTSRMNDAALNCFSEFLPDPAYALASGELNFRVTVRDGSALGGGTGFDDVTLALDPSAGPFLVTSRGEEGTTADAGATETVEWDVAGTDSPDLAENVSISLSVDGGLTFPHVLAASTANDGSEDVVLPDVNAEQARIKVAAVDNYFFDLNNADFAITGAVEPPVAEAPKTRITGGLAKNGFLVGSRTRYTYTSSAEGSTFECTLDGKPLACGSSARTLKGLRPGNHTFTVAAREPGGKVDATPARRHFAVVYNERVLEQTTKGWFNPKSKKAYRGTYYTTSDRGEQLKVRGKRMNRLALLVGKARGFGKVAVYVGKRKVGVVNLASKKPRGKVLVVVERFKKPRTGTIKVRTMNNKPVQIDGLGIFQKP